MQKLNFSKNEIAAFDIDAQQTFTPLCPDELPVAGGDMIAEELNAQAAFASVRVASRDAHTPNAVWIAKKGHAPLTPVTGYENCNLYWPSHAIVGTKGFDFIPGLDPKAYSYQVYKGIEPAMHPYGACYHDLKDTLSTGVIEFLKARGIKAVICPLIGSFLVLRRQSMIGDGLGHIAFAGVAGGALLGAQPVVSAALATVAGALVIEKVRSRLNTFSEMVLAIFFYSGIGLAVIFSSMNRMGGFNLSSILFGSLMTISTSDLWVVAVLGLFACAFTVVFYRPLQYITFDETSARVAGLPAGKLNVWLAVLTALTVMMP